MRGFRFLNGNWFSPARKYWTLGLSFPESIETVTLDNSTAAASGTVFPPALTSVQGNALRMDGAQDVMKMDGAVTNGVLYPFTVTTWAYISVDTNSYQTVFAVEDGAGHSVHYNEFITDSDGTSLTVFDDVTGNLGPVLSMSTGVWYALAFKITAGGWTSYTGTEGFSTLAKRAGKLSNISFNDLTGIGSTTFTATESFNGRFAMYRVWNAELTDEQILAELRSSERLVSAGLLSSVFPQGVSAGNELTAQHGTNVLSRGVGTPDWTFEAGPKLLVQSVGVSFLGNSTSDMTGVYGTGGADGTSAVTLSNSTSTGVGQLQPSGTSAVSLENSTSTGVGQLTPQGTSAVTLANSTATGAGAHGVAGTSAVNLSNSTGTGVGQLTPQGTSAVTLANSTATVIGELVPQGTSAVTLANSTSTGAGTHSITGSSAVTLAASTSTGVGQLTPQGTSAVTLGDSTSTGSGTFIDGVSGTSAVALSDSTSTGAGTHAVASTSSVTLGNSSSTGVGELVPQGTSAVTLANSTSAMSGTASAGGSTGTSTVTLGASSSSVSCYSGATATSSIQLSGFSSLGVGGHGAYEIFNFVPPGHYVTVTVDNRLVSALIDLYEATATPSGLVKADPDGHTLATASVDQRTYS